MEIVLNSCLVAYEKVKKGEMFQFRDLVYFKIFDSDAPESVGERAHVTAIRMFDTSLAHFDRETQVRPVEGKFIENA